MGCITSVAGLISAVLLIVSLDELHFGSSSSIGRQVQSCQSDYLNFCDLINQIKDYNLWMIKSDFLWINEFKVQ